MHNPPSPFTSPTLRADLPTYPVHNQAVRVTSATVPGPSGYMSSSVLGPSLFVGFLQQLNPTTLLPRDREPVFVLDLNGYGLAPGYYTGRLAGSYQSLPVYEVGSAAITSTSGLSPYNGLTPTQQQQLSTLTPQQFAKLANLNVCQLQVLLDALPISQIQTLTLSLTATQLTNFVGQMTSVQFTAIYQQLTTSQIRVISSALNQQQLGNLTSVLTAAQILPLVTGLTTSQLQNLSSYPPTAIAVLATAPNLSIANLATILSVSPLATNPVTTEVVQTAGFTSGTQDNVVVYGSILAVPTTGATTITGIVPKNPSMAETITIANTGNSTISIPHQNGGSSTANQFTTSTSATLSILAGSYVGFTYNPTTSKYTDVSASIAVVSTSSSSITLSSDVGSISISSDSTWTTGDCTLTLAAGSYWLMATGYINGDLTGGLGTETAYVKARIETGGTAVSSIDAEFQASNGITNSTARVPLAVQAIVTPVSSTQYDLAGYRENPGSANWMDASIAGHLIALKIA